tara:strand:+ start:549 stop:926 length:378 start_codon:yes stop_codon:yes gene_type:complete
MMAPKHGERFVELCDSVRGQIRECTVADVHAKLEQGQEILLFDVREDHEWEKGHIPQSQHLGKGIIERDIEEKVPDPEAEVYLYCGGGYRSALAAENLQKMGYRNVISMDGGFRGWKEAGYAVET